MFMFMLMLMLMVMVMVVTMVFCVVSAHGFLSPRRACLSSYRVTVPATWSRATRHLLGGWGLSKVPVQAFQRVQCRGSPRRLGRHFGTARTRGSRWGWR